jgi:hypothetical protein
MQPRGWKSKDTLNKALKELLAVRATLLGEWAESQVLVLPGGTLMGSVPERTWL